MTVPSRPKLILDAAGDVSFASYFTGFVDASTAAVEIFTSPMLGVVSDAVGRRPVLLLSQVGELCALLVIAQFHTNLASYCVAYLLIGLTGAFFTTTASILGDISVSLEDPSAGASYYGVLGATFGGCFLVGPALGGFIEDAFFETASFHAAAILVVVSMLWTYFFVPETRIFRSAGDRNESVVGTNAPSPSDVTRAAGPASVGPSEGDGSGVQRVFHLLRTVQVNPLPRIREIFSNGALQWLAAAVAVSSLAQGGLNSIFFLYLNTRLGWGSAETGYFLSAVGASLLISQGFLVRVAVERFGEARTIIIGYTFAVLHYLVYGVVTKSYIAYVGLAIGCISFIADPAMKGLLCRQVPPSKQGALQGALSGLTTLLRPLAPLFATTIFGYGSSTGNPGIVFAAISIVSGASLVIVLIALRKPGLK